MIPLSMTFNHPWPIFQGRGIISNQISKKVQDIAIVSVER